MSKFNQVPRHYSATPTVLMSSIQFSGELPDVYMIMRATRPLVGLSQTEANVANNAYFVVIDLRAKNAMEQIDSNIKLDASIVMIADEETQQLMSVVGTSHFNKFMEMTPANRKKATAAMVHKLKGLPYQVLAHKQLEALAVIVQEKTEIGVLAEALATLNNLIANGRDFADACFKASQDHHVDYDELVAEYDRECA